MITVKTTHPVAVDSPDHLQPHGTANDNYTSLDFIKEVEGYCSNKGIDKIKFLDLGCSGGQLAIDILGRGHFSVGLEGSDYSAKVGRANWPTYHNANLFTCDVTKEYEVYEDGIRVMFDVITAWEVVEHIHTNDLADFFEHINQNLSDGGIFLASIATHEDVVNGYRLHQSVFSQEEWLNTVLPACLKETELVVQHYPFAHHVRGGSQSFHIMLIKNKI